MASSLLFGAFNKMYLLFFADLNALIRNNNLFSNSVFSLLNFLLAIKTDSDFKMTSTSFNPLLKSVLPELTKSQMASANPMLGAISTLPLIS